MGMEPLEELAVHLRSDAEATVDPATSTGYRVAARWVEDLARYDAGRHSPADAAKLIGFWEAPDTDGHHIVKFRWDKGGLMAVEIARTDGEPLRISDLRDSSVFPFRDLIRRDLSALAKQSRGLDIAVSFYEQERPEDADSLRALAQEFRERVEAPRSPYSQDHWERVARVYSEAVALHDPAPVKAVAEELQVPRSTARNWVANCRKLGYLPPTEERKAKGNPI